MEKKKLENRCSEFVSLKVCRNRCASPEECPSYKNQINPQTQLQNLMYGVPETNSQKLIYGVTNEW